MQKIILIAILVLASLSSFAREEKYTISGMSSGGFMANQMSTIYSSKFSGVATIAGGSYYCAGNYLQNKIKADAFTIGTNNLFLYEPSAKIITDILNPFALVSGSTSVGWFVPSVGNPIYQSVKVCMIDPDLAELPLDYLKANAEARLIDPLSNISEQKVFIYHGNADSVINFKMGQKLKDYYLAVGVREQNISAFAGNSEHNFPTDNPNEMPCNKTGTPYVASCELDITENILNDLFDDKLTRSSINLNHLYVVDQTLDVANKTKREDEWVRPTPSIASYGYLYASDKCVNDPSSCRLHVALHGGAMSDSFNSDFQAKYKQQVRKYRKVTMNSSKVNPADIPVFHNPLINLPTIEEKTPMYGLLKFVLDSGYIKYADQNDLMILFPQTWITEINYPYNPMGCWDWFGWTGEEYATNKGSEPAWLMSFINSVAAGPKKHILNVKPRIDLVEKNFP